MNGIVLNLCALNCNEGTVLFNSLYIHSHSLLCKRLDLMGNNFNVE